MREYQIPRGQLHEELKRITREDGQKLRSAVLGKDDVYTVITDDAVETR